MTHEELDTFEANAKFAIENDTRFCIQPADLIRLIEMAKNGSKAAQDVLAERKRQIEVEGWSPAHDDDHNDRSLSKAAALYSGDRRKWNKAAPPDWPWDTSWWKPKSIREDLVRAGALILAEIERLDRQTNHPGDPSQ